MNKFVATTLIAAASFAAVSANAGLAYSEGADLATNAAVSTLSRAEVQANATRAPITALAYGNNAGATPVAAASTVSRDTVRAQAVQAAQGQAYTITVGQ